MVNYPLFAQVVVYLTSDVFNFSLLTFDKYKCKNYVLVETGLWKQIQVYARRDEVKYPRNSFHPSVDTLRNKTTR